jgi:hypothetical protein
VTRLSLNITEERMADVLDRVKAALDRADKRRANRPSKTGPDTVRLNGVLYVLDRNEARAQAEAVFKSGGGE